MTPRFFLNRLREAGDALLCVTTPEGEIARLTLHELRITESRAARPGAAPESWKETLLSLAPGPGPILRASTLASELASCLKVLPEAENLPLFIEITRAGTGPRRHRLAPPEATGARLLIPLTETTESARPIAPHAHNHDHDHGHDHGHTHENHPPKPLPNL